MYVYILASKRNGTLYTGVTSNLTVRIWEHRQGIKSGFATRNKAYTLVYYEGHDMPEAAILREKQIKKWERPWKLRAFSVNLDISAFISVISTEARPCRVSDKIKSRA